MCKYGNIYSTIQRKKKREFFNDTWSFFRLIFAPSDRVANTFQLVCTHVCSEMRRGILFVNSWKEFARQFYSFGRKRLRDLQLNVCEGREVQFERGGKI